MSTPADLASFEQLLEHLRQTRGFDFTAYKHTTLMRRVQKRMQTVDVAEFDEYIDYLQLHPDEFLPARQHHTINVTSFFRDSDVWAYIDAVILPQLLEALPAAEPLRVWSAGCASGEEAYSVAMLLAERVGIEAARDRVKIYATDVDEEALAEGRRAIYTLKDLVGVPPGFSEKYFTVTVERAAQPRTAARVIFGRHRSAAGRADLAGRPAALPQHADVLQRRRAAPDHQPLLTSRSSPRGYLMLGRAEMLFSHTALFAPVDLARRIFRVRRGAEQCAIGWSDGQDGTMANAVRQHTRDRQAAFDADRHRTRRRLRRRSGARQRRRARSISASPNSDLGTPLQDLDVSYRPVELRSAIDRVTADRQAVILKDVPHVSAGQPRQSMSTLRLLSRIEQARSVCESCSRTVSAVHRLQA